MGAMSLSHGEITHVSDTALMVAACRALEFECADGFVHDPFAARLAGERGMAMLRALPQPGMMRFGIGVRSRFMDELLLLALASEPIATVLSVGCGLDTRPWRLELPPDLRWIEVDFADLLDYKEALMSGETPRCRRERITADLNDAAERRTIYAAVGPAPALMITEGLLMYLPASTVEELAAEAWQQSGIAQWMSDITTKRVRESHQYGQDGAKQRAGVRFSARRADSRRGPPAWLGDRGAAELHHRYGVCDGADSSPDGRSSSTRRSAAGSAGRSDRSAPV